MLLPDYQFKVSNLDLIFALPVLFAYCMCCILSVNLLLSGVIHGTYENEGKVYQSRPIQRMLFKLNLSILELNQHLRNTSQG